MRMLKCFYHVNICYQLTKGYLGRELQDMEKVVVYTTDRYLSDKMTRPLFNAAKTVQGNLFFMIYRRYYETLKIFLGQKTRESSIFHVMTHVGFSRNIDHNRFR